MGESRFSTEGNETLARRGELVALEVRDIDFHPNGTDQALIRRGKTDAEGQGRVAYLSRETVKWLKIWAITQAGGWKSTRMPLQYAEKINAARSGMARAAAATGRDEAVSESR
jgi:integrase